MARETDEIRRGPIFAIGGAEDKTKGRAILRAFVDAAGGFEASIVVLSTASEIPTTGDRYQEIFQSLEVDSVEVIDVRTREEAFLRMDQAVNALEYATGIFLTGGNQLRLSTIFGGTPLAEAIRRRNQQGLAVAGTSAGAAVLSEHMIAYGQSGSAPQRRKVALAPGMGLVQEAIIDQHFTQRDRLGRLLAATSFNPRLLGLGIDEDTAAIIDADGVVSILGSGSATVVDASGMSYSSAASVTSTQPIAMLGLRVDVLTAGCRYDLRARVARPPEKGAVAAAAAAMDAAEVTHEDC